VNHGAREKRLLGLGNVGGTIVKDALHVDKKFAQTRALQRQHFDIHHEEFSYSPARNTFSIFIDSILDLSRNCSIQSVFYYFLAKSLQH